MELHETIILLRKYKEGILSDSEWAALWEWLEQGDSAQLNLALDVIGKDNAVALPDLEIFAGKLEGRLDEIDKRAVRKYRLRYWSAAAAVLLLLGTGLFMWKEKIRQPIAPVVALTDNRAVSNKAVLLLPGGKQVVLDDSTALNGLGGKDAIVRKDSSRLSYLLTERSDIPSYHTLITPKGGQFSIVLSDGTKVWLNAASSLYYPTSFPGRDREVILTGEAYFEVAEQPSKPFRVRVNDIQVTVLGTSFNVSAYAEDNEFRATLVSGAVKVNNQSEGIKLAPGKQASLHSGATSFKVEQVDTDIVTAWRKGLFRFDNADIKTITSQIARWYDVEVEFRGKMPARKFMGTLSRKEPLPAILKVLEGTDVKFELNGRKLLVTSVEGRAL
ncbi:FecR family protein [Chitinophaga sp. 22321]|uniref:FecR family protein n=1 Tax=Chitinophaga hostae TaxID=2831022 RepID=A0ABS5J7W7_9BACT|nr:FecR family protein [Chitinophaga hostae]MBS0030507.1 FecR family protein [Chitinophaga hostae]